MKDTYKLIDELEKTASELEQLAAQPVKQATASASPMTEFLDGMVEHLGLNEQ